eukprot:11998400-Alexandrium_andersonii.AAC.1
MGWRPPQLERCWREERRARPPSAVGAYRQQAEQQVLVPLPLVLARPEGVACRWGAPAPLPPAPLAGVEWAWPSRHR